MSCPHSTRPEASPASCSLCIGIVAERRVLNTIPDGDVFEFVESTLSNWGMSSERHRETSRRGGLAAADARRPRRQLMTDEQLSEVRRAAACRRWSTVMTPEERASKISALHHQGKSPKEIAEAVPCGLSSVYRTIKGAA